MQVSYCMNVVTRNNVTNSSSFLELHISQRHIKQTVYAKYFSEHFNEYALKKEKNHKSVNISPTKNN